MGVIFLGKTVLGKHRTVASDGFDSRYENIPRPKGRGIFLEQDTGIEPATVAWEATVLPLN